LPYTISEIAKIIDSDHPLADPGQVIDTLAIDSRRLIREKGVLFIALKGAQHDGHAFVPELARQGISNFLITRLPDEPLGEVNYLVVSDTLAALQQLAAYHRQQFGYPVVAVTGSNGKTTVKEWIVQMLAGLKPVVSSPKSYNSQVGVPLSVWAMDQRHQVAVFEAGISQPGEMEKLEKILQPDIGIITNLGPAHDEGFNSSGEKLQEKLKLFTRSRILIYCADDPVLRSGICELKSRNPSLELFSWSVKSSLVTLPVEIKPLPGETYAHFRWHEKDYSIMLPFTEQAMVSNALQVLSVLLALDIPPDRFVHRFRELRTLPLRLELKKTPDNSLLIYDCYNSDLQSLRLALEFMHQQAGSLDRTVILSDMLQTGRDRKELYKQVAGLLEQFRVSRLIGVGPEISSERSAFAFVKDEKKQFFPDTEALMKALPELEFQNECILLKGARAYAFEKLGKKLEQKTHTTVLEINLNALVNNLSVYRRQLRPGTRLMVMVKAASYGSGIDEIARTLQYHQVDYYGVAYADEGILLRKAGVSAPVFVMNATAADFDNLISWNMEPEIYSLQQLNDFTSLLKERGRQGRLRVHLKLNTGMNRLGLDKNQVVEAINRILGQPALEVVGVLTHMAASEDPSQDDFTRKQVQLFVDSSEKITRLLQTQPLRHVLNSGGIARFPEWQFDMVRLGIGLYGYDPSGVLQKQLQPLFTLKTRIAQIRNLRPGDSVGYSRAFQAEKPVRMAVIGLGYADGIPRSLSQGKGKVWINGKLCPVIGNVCMDMTMIDISRANEAKEGDEVIIFGRELPVEQVARWAGTIPYEILSSLSQRIRRVYFED